MSTPPPTQSEEKTPVAKIGGWFDAVEKLLKGLLSLFVAAKGLGFIPTDLELTTEQLLLPAILVFVGMPALQGLFQRAFPQHTPRSMFWNRCLSRLQLAHWRVVFVVFALIIVGLLGYWTNREIINKPPHIEEIVPLNSVIVPNDSTTLTAIVTDPDGYQDITGRIAWSTDPGKGSIEVINPPKNDIARFHAPVAAGAYNIYVTVTDRSGKTTSKTITVYVASPSP